MTGSYIFIAICYLGSIFIVVFIIFYKIFIKRLGFKINSINGIFRFVATILITLVVTPIFAILFSPLFKLLVENFLVL